jgi:uridine phosphorylase
MPTHLRPTAPIATDAVLVGDPGRALLLAQELLEEPKMSNHARGLWGYTGETPEGRRLTIQATGIGGPSAALVLADLAELGVRRAVRVGTCVALDETFSLGELVVVTEAIGAGGSGAALGIVAGEAVAPDPTLTERLDAELGTTARPAQISSFDLHPTRHLATEGAADMQSASLLARARSLDVEMAAVLIVTETSDGRELGKNEVEQAERRAGRAASAVFLT